MTDHDLDPMIVDAISKGCDSFAKIHTYISRAIGNEFDFRVVDRRLQALKRAGQIEFVRTPPLGWQIRSWLK